MMKTKHIAIMALLSLVCPIILTGCGNTADREKMDYTVTCTLDSKLRHDSATLLVLEEQYNSLRVCASSRTDGNSFTFKGQTDGPKVALIRWDNDSTKPFYFVLEQGDITIDIGTGSWHITGSPMNTEYQHFVNERARLMDKRVAAWQEYLSLSSSASLKRDDETRLVREDSLLNDSLQRITVERINRGDAVGRIIRERYGQQLDQQHMRQLK